MAQIVLNIPDAVISRVLDAYADLYNWDGVNPPTKAQFAKQQIGAQIRDVVKRSEIRESINVVTASIESNVSVT